MQVLFESRHPEGHPLRDEAVRRVHFVMRRLTWLVPRARVCLSDDNGPRGGVDSALARAARVLMRHLRRSQRVDRDLARA